MLPNEAQTELFKLKTQVRDFVESLYSAECIQEAVDQLRALVDDLDEFAEGVQDMEDDLAGVCILPMRAA